MDADLNERNAPPAQIPACATMWRTPVVQILPLCLPPLGRHWYDSYWYEQADALRSADRLCRLAAGRRVSAIVGDLRTRWLAPAVPRPSPLLSPR
jgi:hypothetical protein